MMTTIDTSTDTAPRVRRGKRKHVMSPEEMLASFRHPGASAAEVREAAHNHIVTNSVFEDEATRAFNMWAFDGFLALKVKDFKPAPERRAAKAKAEATKEQVAETLRRGFEKKIEEAATIRLLEHVTPNGLKLADCTGAMCRNLGGWYSAVSKRLNPRDHVGNHLDEIELHAARWRILENRP
jgi:hypothetical protein